MAVPPINPWSEIATSRTDAPNVPTASGDNRVRLVVTYTRGTPAIDNATTGVSYGGQALTQIAINQTTAGADVDTQVFLLDEAGIQAAADDEITFTPAVSGDGFRAISAAYDNIDQVSEVVDSFIAEGASSANPPTEALDSVDDGIALAVLASSQGPNSGTNDAAYSNMTERLEISSGNIYLSVADADTTAPSFTPGTTLTHTQTGQLIGIALRAAPPPTAQASAAVTTTGTATGTKIKFASASAAVQTTGQANGTRIIQGQASASIEAATAATGLKVKFATASADFVTDTTANGANFAGASASATVTFTATATASPPIPSAPTVPLADSFLNAIRPVFLVDLFFDSAELNIWTRPFDGEFFGTSYQALAGITSGLSIRNSLDSASLDASIQLSGQSQELLNIALTEPYRGRPARVRLGNIGDDGEIESAETIMLGTISNMPITDSADASTVSIVIDSVFRTVNRPTQVFRQSTADQALTSPDDSFYDFTETTSVTEPRFGDG